MIDDGGWMMDDLRGYLMSCAVTFGQPWVFLGAREYVWARAGTFEHARVLLGTGGYF